MVHSRSTYSSQSYFCGAIRQPGCFCDESKMVTGCGVHLTPWFNFLNRALVAWFDFAAAVGAGLTLFTRVSASLGTVLFVGP